MTARDEVLARIRRANAAAAAPPPGELPPGEPGPRYRTRGERPEAELLDLLASRLTDYRATVRRTTAAGLGGQITAALASRGARRVVVPPGLDLPGLDLPGLDLPGLDLRGLDGLAPDVEIVVDDGLDARALDACDGAVTEIGRAHV